MCNLIYDGVCSDPSSSPWPPSLSEFGIPNSEFGGEEKGEKGLLIPLAPFSDLTPSPNPLPLSGGC